MMDYNAHASGELTIYNFKVCIVTRLFSHGYTPDIKGREDLLIQLERGKYSNRTILLYRAKVKDCKKRAIMENLKTKTCNFYGASLQHMCQAFLAMGPSDAFLLLV